ncbi:MAG: SDR family oxidoreductase [Solirubrobacteraceae bacterium]|jgi:uncharacterized protein YbjT (DUF2867 family)
MDVVVAGGHGKVAQRLLERLAAAGDRARGLIRNPDHAADLERLGAEPVLADLEAEQDISRHLVGADAVVFAAGAGPGSGPERKRTVDLGGALKLIEGARAQGVGRYVMVSAMGAADPAAGPPAMRPYLEAKAEADAALRASGLEWTIVRPGRLTDDPATGRVAVAPGLHRHGEIPRDDTAAVLAATLHAPSTIGLAFEVLAGDTPVEEAVAALQTGS